MPLFGRGITPGAGVNASGYVWLYFRLRLCVVCACCDCLILWFSARVFCVGMRHTPWGFHVLFLTSTTVSSPFTTSPTLLTNETIPPTFSSNVHLKKKLPVVMERGKVYLYTYVIVPELYVDMWGGVRVQVFCRPGSMIIAPTIALNYI